MRFLSLMFVLFAACLAPAHAQIPGLPIIDFQRYFPHLVAVSDEVKDSTYPQGVQYKFLTVRDEQEKVIVLALVRREGQDRVVRVFLAKGPIENSESTLRSTVERFSSNTQMKFEFVDLRSIRSFSDFEAQTKALGWGVDVLPK